MGYKFASLRTAIIAAGCVLSSVAYAAPDARGVWVNDTGRGAIEIKDCGDKLCGHVVWTRDAADASRGCGKQMIGDVAASGGGVWDGGWVYSPDKKRRYDVELKPLSNGTLRVVGYAGTKFFSKTMIWTKAPDDLKRCDATEASATPAPAAPAANEKTTATTPAPATSSPPANEAKSQEKTSPEKEKVADRPPPASALQALTATDANKNADKAKTEAKSPEPKQAAVPPAATESNGKKADTEVAEDETSDGKSGNRIEDMIDEMDGKKIGKGGYGIKKLADGDCRVKLPFITLKVHCKR